MLRSVLLIVLAAGSLAAQDVTGTLVGTVQDPSGARVTGAAVTVQNAGTNRVVKTTTDDRGDYVVVSLPAATYAIHVDATGFRPVDVTGVVLPLNATVRNNVHLEVGTQAQRVEVAAAPAAVSTDTSSVGGVIDTHATAALPLNGRTLDRLLFVQAGSTSNNYSSAPNIGGSLHWGGTYFSVDGVTFNDTGNGGGAYSYATALSTTPSIDTIQEFKVESSVAKAEYPGSATVSMITRSGTNGFHGSLFEFNRNREFAAKNFFATGLAKPPFNRNELGATTGGRIIRDRTFFFASYEGLFQRTSSNPYLAVATVNERQGNFAGLPAITDPTTGHPFPNNQIPASRIDTRSQTLLGYYPAANLPGTGAAGTGLNYITTVGTKYDVNRGSLKIDHAINSANVLTFSGNYSRGDPYFVALGTPANYGNFANGGYTTKSASLTETATLSANKVNEFRIAYFNHASIRIGQNTDFNPASLFPALYQPLPLGGLPSVSMTGYAGIGDYGGADHSPEITEQISDNFTWIKGAHTIKAGMQIGLNRISLSSGISSTALGSFTFNGRYTGNAFADFLLGDLVASARQSPQPATVQSFQYDSFFVQDDWKVNSRLTLNLGLRYELQTAASERSNLFTNFDFAKGTFVIRTTNGQLPAAARATLLSLYPYVTSQQAGWNQMYYADKNNFAPRFGFAYRLTDDAKTVVRGGYGIFYNLVPFYIGIRQISQLNPPFILTQSYEAAAGTTPSLTFANPFPGTGTISANPTIYAVDRHLRNTLSQQWNLTVEREIAAGTALRVTYLGNKATRVPWYLYNANLPLTQTAGTIQSHRPYQPWGDIYILTSNGNSFTNQLQIELTKRYANGIYLQSSYTLNKSIDDVPVVGGPQNPYYASGDRGLADGIRKHNYFLTATYDLPFKARGPLNYLVSGWTLGTLAQVTSGTPFTVTFSPNQAGWYATRPNATGADPYPAQQTLRQWFNPAAFTVPAAFTFGNAGRNILTGPGLVSIDFNVAKQFRFRERASLQVRADAFNLPNSANFSTPSANISSSTAGQISSTSISNRVVQFGMKVLF